ncbi:MAG: hypothetical protein JEZ01_21165 [Labilibaculum sp.]|nr:phage/plasmid primase, P4 family [Labilibaculum sp.]MBI9060291.1 hypothetical protein [Labilibaculum sp.]
MEYDDDLLQKYQEEYSEGETTKLPQCSEICGNNLCKNIKALNGYSPLNFMLDYMEKYNETEVANMFIKYYHEKVKNFTHYNSFYFYNNKGLWVMENSGYKLKTIINHMMLLLLPSKETTRGRINNIEHRMQVSRDLLYEEKVAPHKYIFNFQNGLYDIREKKLMPHTHKHIAFTQLPIAFDPEATAPLFEEKTLEIFSGDTELVNYFLDWMLYTMIPEYSYQKILMFVGNGRNGKSVLANLWRAFLGDVHTSNERLSDLATDKGYSLAQVENALLNISSESDTKTLEKEMLKMLTGEDKVSTREIYKERRKFVNFARLLVLANQLPKFKSLDRAMVDRIEIIHFKERFADNPDPQLANKLIAELPGILNLVLARIDYVIDSNGNIQMSPPNIISENTENLLKEMDSVIKYAKEGCTFAKDEGLAEGEYVTKLQDFYDKYLEWCSESEEEIIPETRIRVKETLANMFNLECRKVPYIKTTSGKVTKNQDWIIGIKPNSISQVFIANISQIRNAS